MIHLAVARDNTPWHAKAPVLESQDHWTWREKTIDFYKVTYLKRW